MEKKTLGAFIAALRKANGLTQRQLAEKLNVSDKAISRWERDEAMPDLSLIPVLAEIFGVTADELLRGERNSGESAPANAKPKSEKQRRRLLAALQSKYQVRSAISIGIAILGLIAAMICNFAFQRAYLGFMLGCIFYAASVICQISFLILGLSRLDEEMFKEKELTGYRKDTVHLGLIVISIAVILLAFSLPLVLLPWDPYLGLTFGSWLPGGILCSILAAAGTCIGMHIIDNLADKKGLYPIDPIDPALKRLRITTLILTAVILVLTLIGHAAAALTPTDTYAEVFIGGTVFEDWQSFRKHMETPTDALSDIVPPGQSSAVIQPTDPDYIIDGIDPYEAPIQTIKAPDGTVLCSYRPLNETVSYIVYSESDDKLPVTVYSQSEFRAARELKNYLNQAFRILYIIELISAAVIYHMRKRKTCK